MGIGTTGWGPWATYGASVSSGEITIGDNTIPPAKFTGAGRPEFIETFDIPINASPWIFTGSGAGSITYPAEGVDGGKVLQAGGALQAYAPTILIPFDPRKLYRLRVRMRHTLVSDAAKALVYAGVVCLDKNKAQISNVYCTAYGFNTYPAWLPSGSWHELSGWFEGAKGTAVHEAHDPANPTSCPVGTAWISPIFSLNWDAGNLGDAIGNVMQIDDWRLESPDISDNQIGSGKLSGSARTEFVETFDEPLGDQWDLVTGSGTGSSYSYVKAGVDGGYVIQTAGSVPINCSGTAIPYDPRKLYRMTVRARTMLISDATKAEFYAGVGCYNQDKTGLGYIHCAAFAINANTAWSPHAAAWHEVTGWFKGVGGGSIQPAPDSQNPSQLPVGTVWIFPTVLCCWQPSAPAGNQMQVDDIRIEIFDEETYASPAPNGTFGTLSKWIVYPSGDDASSAMTLYWEYTQGLVKAQQFSIFLSDGAAFWTQRFRALPGTGVLKHSIALYRVAKNRALTITVTAEAIRPGGQTAGPTASWGTFTPSVSSGSSPTGYTDVGSIDWAQGNIWFDSYQYRNSIGPSNGTGSITIQFIHAGSGAAHIVLTGLNSYSQGSYIATHLSVIVKTPSGTIDLNSDCVVARISAISIPATFRVPMDFADNQSFTVAVVAVAMVKNGAVPNTTWTPVTKNAGYVQITSSNSPYQVYLGNQSNLSENIFAWRPLRMEQPYGEVQWWEGTSGTGTGGTKRGGIAADSTGVYIQNQAGKWFYMQPGSSANFAFGNISYFGNMTNGIAIQNGGGWSYGQSRRLWIPAVLSWRRVTGSTSSGNTEKLRSGRSVCEKCGYDFWLVAVENQTSGQRRSTSAAGAMRRTGKARRRSSIC